MYTALPSRRGCSQVLFLEIMSPHFDSITLRLQRWVGATLLDRCQRASCAPTSPTIRWNYESVEYNSHIPCVQTPFLSALDGVVCLGSASSLGCGTLHPSLAESHAHPTCFIRPRTPPQHLDDKNWDYLSKSGSQILRDTKPTSRSSCTDPCHRG